MMKQMIGKAQMNPGVLAATTYALLFAAIFAISSIVCMVSAQRLTPASAGPDRKTGGA
jgi:hypothetical protein